MNIPYKKHTQNLGDCIKQSTKMELDRNSICSCDTRFYAAFRKANYVFSEVGGKITDFPVGACIEKAAGFGVPMSSYSGGYKSVGCGQNDTFVGQKFTISRILRSAPQCVICEDKQIKRNVKTTCVLTRNDGKEFIFTEEERDPDPYFRNWVKCFIINHTI